MIVPETGESCSSCSHTELFPTLSLDGSKPLQSLVLRVVPLLGWAAALLMLFQEQRGKTLLLRNTKRIAEDRRVGLSHCSFFVNSLMKRWRCVCQQSCRLWINGCLSCRWNATVDTHRLTVNITARDGHWAWDDSFKDRDCVKNRHMHSIYKRQQTFSTLQ